MRGGAAGFVTAPATTAAAEAIKGCREEIVSLVRSPRDRPPSSSPDTRTARTPGRRPTYRPVSPVCDSTPLYSDGKSAAPRPLRAEASCRAVAARRRAAGRDSAGECARPPPRIAGPCPPAAGQGAGRDERSSVFAGRAGLRAGFSPQTFFVSSPSSTGRSAALDRPFPETSCAGRLAPSVAGWSSNIAGGLHAIPRRPLTARRVGAPFGRRMTWRLTAGRDPHRSGREPTMVRDRDGRRPRSCKLRDGRPVNFLAGPSADVLWCASVGRGVSQGRASPCPSRAWATDGAEGAKVIAAAGVRCSPRNKETSVVWGMPGGCGRQGLIVGQGSSLSGAFAGPSRRLREGVAVMFSADESPLLQRLLRERSGLALSEGQGVSRHHPP